MTGAVCCGPVGFIETNGLSMFKSADSKLNVELDPEPKLSFRVGESRN